MEGKISSQPHDTVDDMTIIYFYEVSINLNKTHNDKCWGNSKMNSKKATGRSNKDKE